MTTPDFRKRLIVVLGMHRSGTSAVARALQVFGVELGDRLMPPMEGNNPKGFWEDIDLNAVNIEMLDAVGSDWHHVAPIEPGDVETLRRKGYFLRAVELLRQKMRGTDMFGFKDPRVAKLLPFWKEVFRHCQLDASYIITTRNPLSVAKSLAKRDHLHMEKNYLMWLGHVISGLSASTGDKRVLVDYDRLMQSPDHELNRIAENLELEMDAAELQRYQSEFLDGSLRHTIYDVNDLLLDNACPPLAREIYSVLLSVAADKTRLDDPALQKRIAHWQGELERLKSCLTLVDRLFTEKGLADQAVVERDGRIAELNDTVAERDEQIAELNDTVAERDEQIAELNDTVAERDGQIAELNDTLAERDRQIAGLDHNLAERDGQIADLNQAAAERDNVITQLVTSTSWRLTRPMRAIKSTLTNKRSSFDPKKDAFRRFNAEWYLKCNPDVRVSGISPEEHYRLFGKAEGRPPAPDPFFLRNLKRLELMRKGAPVALRQAGGIKAAMKKVPGLLKREGAEGIKSRLIAGHHQTLLFAGNTEIVGHVGAATLAQGQDGHYRFESPPGTYTYIPPRRPDNVDHIVETMEQKPTFSILVPVYNTPPELLKKLMDSVATQWYPHWELILADDASSSVETQNHLARINDPRVILLTLPSNHGIAGATNAALARATGDFVVLLDHDDELTEDCLFELALCINRDNPDYIYSDEDKISPDGRFTEPHFKPDWSPDTLMSTMYVCHVSCIRRSLLETINGFRPGYDGCQDWDLILRLVEKTDRISHIPKVLYHWRIIPGSVAANIEAKPYVLDASKRAREEALRRRGLIGAVEAVEQVTGYFRVNYHLQGTPLISIIIPSRDNAEVLSCCIESIVNVSSYRNFELIVLDNGSVEPATLACLETIKNRANATVIRHDAPFNFSELNNIGANQARGDILLFLNDDTEVTTADWLERMGGYAQLDHVGAVGAKLLYPGGREIQHAGIVNLQDGPGHAFLRQHADRFGYFMRSLLEYNWLAVTGACLMIQRGKFEAVGGFDETFPIAYNDIDLCMRLRDAGWYNVVCQAVELIHHESVSRGLDHLSEDKRARLAQEKRRLYEKHSHYFQHDPFHNVNLHPNGIHFEVPA